MVPTPVRRALVALAVVSFVIVALLAFALVDEHSAARIDDAIGWAGIGLALLAAGAL